MSKTISEDFFDGFPRVSKYPRVARVGCRAPYYDLWLFKKPDPAFALSARGLLEAQFASRRRRKAVGRCVR